MLLLSGMVTSLTNFALLTQSAAFSGTNAVGVGEGVTVISPVTGITTSVAVFVAVGGAVVAGTAVGVSVACAACPPQADNTIPVSKMIESTLLDMLVSFVQAHKSGYGKVVHYNLSCCYSGRNINYHRMTLNKCESLKHHHLTLRLLHRVADELFIEGSPVQDRDICQRAHQAEFDDIPAIQPLA